MTRRTISRWIPMFSWFKTKARRREELLSSPFPRPWQELLHRRLWQYQRLSLTERDKLHDFIKVMVAEKSWEGCDGLEVTDGMRVTIAGHAALMLLGTSGYYFDGVQSILVYPRAFDRRTNNGGIYDSELRAGEAWQDGPIVLAWNNVMATSQYYETAGNVVIHEFAHHLDGLDGEMSGSPIFDSQADQRRWADVMGQEYADLRSAAASGYWTVLKHYGAKNKAEFFAVASESFFERPRQLQSTHPELYELLQTYYRIDPMGWT